MGPSLITKEVCQLFEPLSEASNKNHSLISAAQETSEVNMSHVNMNMLLIQIVIMHMLK